MKWTSLFLVCLAMALWPTHAPARTSCKYSAYWDDARVTTMGDAQAVRFDRHRDTPKSNGTLVYQHWKARKGYKVCYAKAVFSHAGPRIIRGRNWFQFLNQFQGGVPKIKYVRVYARKA
jgi:hypothetical protein